MSSASCPKRDVLNEYCRGQLPPAVLDEVESHVSRCSVCQEEITRLDGASETLIHELRQAAAPAAGGSKSDPLAAGMQLVKAIFSAPTDATVEFDSASAQPGATGRLRVESSSWSPGQPPRTLDEFLRCAEASGLFTPDEVRQLGELAVRREPSGVAASSGDAPDGLRPAATSLARQLVSTGRLTPFQAKALLCGRPDSLLLGPREVLAPIGQGGMGRVYKVRHRRLDRVEAVKLLAPEFLDSPASVARFEREAKAAARVTHPNLVTIYDADRHHDVHFLAMELIEGCDLARLVKDHGPLPIEQAVDCIAQAAAGLQAAHDAGITHRDVKPHNLLLDRRSHRVKVLDLGLARINDENAQNLQRAALGELTTSGQIMGTLDYLSPEQALDTRHADARSDIYSLGCTLYFLLTGRPPYDGDTPAKKLFAHRDAPVPSARALRPEIPAELDTFLKEKLLAKSPNDRCATMSDVAAQLRSLGLRPEPPALAPATESPATFDLDAYLASPANTQDFPRLSPSSAAIAPVPAPAPAPPSPRRPLALLTGLAAVLLLLGVIVLNFRTPYGDVEVVLDEGVADDVKIELTQGGKVLDVIDAKKQWQITLREGKYSVQLGEGTEDRFEVRRDHVIVRRGNVSRVEVRLKIRPPEPPKPGVAVMTHKPSFGEVIGSGEPAMKPHTFWRCKFTQPPEGWTTAGFDDRAWRVAPGPFRGPSTPPQVTPVTWWPTKELYLRREIVLSADEIPRLAFWYYHDEDVTIYLNGVVAAKSTGFRTEFEPASAEAKAAARVGKNVLAVHCLDREGGRYCDVRPLITNVEPRDREFRYQLSLPDPSWMRPSFDDSAWHTGLAPFSGPNKPLRGTHWQNQDLWVRREIDLGDNRDAWKNLALHIWHDEEADVYLNGERFAYLDSVGHNLIVLSDRDRQRLQPGRNVLAIHCVDRVHARELDAEFVSLPAEAGLPTMEATPSNGTSSWQDMPASAATLNGNRYVVFDFPVPQYVAQEICEALGGHLARIESAESQQFLAQMARTVKSSDGVWIDGSDAEVEGIWKYGNGRNMTFFNWNTNEPGNFREQEHWSMMNCETGNWHDLDACAAKPFLCEWELRQDSERVAKPLIRLAGAVRPPVEFNGHWYSLISKPVVWHDAKAACEHLGGHLVCVESQSEQDFLARNLLQWGSEVWIGATDERSEGRFEWVNGADFEYANWYPGEPNNSENVQHYAFLRFTGAWDDHGGARFPFVCEWLHPPKTPAEYLWSHRAETVRGIHFDEASYLEVPSFKYDGSFPITVEAIVTPEARVGSRTIVADSDQAGWRFVVDSGSWQFVAHDGTSWQSVNSWSRVTLGEPTHIASEWDGKQMRVFLNGDLRHVRTVTSLKPSMRSLIIGAAPGADGSTKDHFHGIIHAVRITKGARYGKSFDVPKKFNTDTQAAGLWILDDIRDGRVEDRSGNRHHAYARGNLTRMNRLPAELLADEAPSQQTQASYAKAHKLPVEWSNSVGMTFRIIPPGRYRVGKDASSGWNGTSIVEPFYCGATEVTQRQFRDVVGKNPSRYAIKDKPDETERLPVENVSWLEAIDFCNRLSEREHIKPYYHVADKKVTAVGGDGYRLLWDREWVCAASGGDETRHWQPDFKWEDHAWFADNSGNVNHLCGMKLSNEFGLHDIFGNVWEWLGERPLYKGLPRHAAARELHTDNGHWSVSVDSCGGDVGFRVARNVPSVFRQDGPRFVTLKTGKGDIRIELLRQHAPQAVNNFLELASRGFYRGQTFFKVVQDSLIQAGDPTGTGSGGESIFNLSNGGTFADEIDPVVKMQRGTVAMANRGPNTNQSQFFIVVAKNGAPHLDGKHTIFGRVVEGLDVADAISQVPVERRGPLLQPVAPVTFDVEIDNGQQVHSVTADTLQPGRWYDLLATVDVEKHVIDGLADRTPDGIRLVHGWAPRFLAPVRISGSYELQFSFTRISGRDDVQLVFPIGPHRVTSLMFSPWKGRASGLAKVDGKEGRDDSRTEAVVRPGAIENGKRYHGLLRVDVDGDQVYVGVQLNGKPYFSWAGTASRLSCWPSFALPRNDILGFGTCNASCVVHSLALRPRTAPAKRWNPAVDLTSATPPDEIKSECVQWNGHWYWCTGRRLERHEAIALAERYGGRLLEVRSASENKFITEQFSQYGVWLGAWRSGRDVNPRTHWLNDRLDPLSYIGPWAHDQPQAASGETYLGLVTGAWHDFEWDARLHTCVEWGDEATQDHGEVPVVAAARTPPPEFTLKTNGLGGKDSVEPIVWTREWIEPGNFAHVKGWGDIVYPHLNGIDFALDLDFTFQKSMGRLSLYLGDEQDANLWIPFDIGMDPKNPDLAQYKVRDWMNGARWYVGHVETKVGQRNRISVVVKESKLGIIRDGQRVHHGDTELVDATFHIVSESPDMDVVIHAAQLRPLTLDDCRVMGWKFADTPADIEVAAAKARIASVTEELTGDVEMGKSFVVSTTQTPLRWIDAGTGKMNRPPNEFPVKFTKGYWMGYFEITQREWLLLMQQNPSRILGSPYLPVDCVTYDDALAFCRLLTAKELEAGRVPEGYEYRLPTEAEWEYCCRAGREGMYKAVAEEIWSSQGTGWRPRQVGEAKANPWGLFDLPGNVTEWCLDAWHDYPQDTKAVRVDPFVPPLHWQQRRIVRGGTGWRSNEGVATERTSHASVAGGYRGFRVVLGPVLTDRIPPTAFDPFAKVEPKKPDPLPPALPVPAAGQKLEVGKWYDLLATIDVEKHAINGRWLRKPDGLHAFPGSANRGVSPVVIHGDFELQYRFRRVGRPEAVTVAVPVGDDATADVAIGGWGNRISGIGRLKGESADQRKEGLPGAIRRGIDADRVYDVRLTVTSKDDQGAIDVTLDGNPFFAWSGPRSDLGRASFWVSPRQDVLAIGTWETSAVIHDLRLKMLTGDAQRWTSESPTAATEPPTELASQCVKWKGRSYWKSPAIMDFAAAKKLATQHKARLLTISSFEEDAFIRATWPKTDLWLSAWRNANDPNPKTGWVDERLRLLRYFGEWGRNQPDGNEYSLGIWREGGWGDFAPTDNLFTVLEWGAEGTSPNTHDLLHSIRLPEDVVAGSWRLMQGRLTCGVSDFTRIGSRYRPQGSYALRATLRWPIKVGEANVLFPVGDGECCLRLRENEVYFPDVPRSPKINLASHEAFQAKKDYSLEIAVSVQESTAVIQVHVDGKRLLNWSGSAAGMRTGSGWSIPNRTIGFGSHLNVLQVVSAELDSPPETCGRIEYRRGDPLPINEWINLHASLDLSRSQRYGDWIVGKDFVRSQNGEFVRIVLPVHVAGAYELRCKVETAGNWGEINFLLPFGRSQGMASFHAEKTFLQQLAVPHPDKKVKLPVKASLLWRVRPEGDEVTIEGELDGESIYRWSGKQSAIGMRFDWPITPYQFALGVHLGSVTFRNIELRVLSGTVSKLIESSESCAAALSQSVRPADVSRMELVLDADFSKTAAGFDLGESSNIKAAHVGGELQLFKKSRGVWWPGQPTLQKLDLNHFVCEVEAQFAKAHPDGWGLALLPTKPPSHPWTGVQINGSGQVGIHLYDEKPLLPWTGVPSLRSVTEPHTLRVEVAGTHLRIFVNGQHVADAVHDRLRSSGLTLYGFGTNPPLDVRFRRVRVWRA